MNRTSRPSCDAGCNSHRCLRYLECPACELGCIIIAHVESIRFTHELLACPLLACAPALKFRTLTEILCKHQHQSSDNTKEMRSLTLLPCRVSDKTERAKEIQIEISRAFRF